LTVLRLLKALGLDIPARIAELQQLAERRVEKATDEAKATVQQAAVTAMVAVVAAIAAAAALAIGLVALDRWLAENYGAYVGYGVVALILVVASGIFGAIAWTRSRRSLHARQNRGEAATAKAHAAGRESAAPQSAQARAAATAPEAPQREAASAAAVLIELLPLLVSLLARWPAAGGSPIGTLTASLRRTAGGKAVQGAINQIREGDRLNLLAAVAGAALIGWLVMRRTSRDQHIG
jgi:hypothetical protein